jgi:hypothetical protein
MTAMNNAKTLKIIWREYTASNGEIQPISVFIPNSIEYLIPKSDKKLQII